MKPTKILYIIDFYLFMMFIFNIIILNFENFYSKHFIKITYLLIFIFEFLILIVLKVKYKIKILLEICCFILIIIFYILDIFQILKGFYFFIILSINYFYHFVKVTIFLKKKAKERKNLKNTLSTIGNSIRVNDINCKNLDRNELKKKLINNDK